MSTAVPAPSPALSEEKQSDAEEAYVPARVHWFRSTITQTLITGLCAFLAPGLWGAMASVGAGGQQKPYLVNAANAISNGIMVFECLLGGWLINRLGFKYALAIGGLGYAPYAAGLYANSVYGTQWLILFGAATCGLSAGLFWAVEPAIILAYPEASVKGRHIGIFLALKNGGSLIAGAINLGLNARTASQGSLSPNTFIVFIALQCVGPFVGLLLSNPLRVQRKDGSTVQAGNDAGLKEELHALWKIFLRPEVAAFMPFGVYSFFCLAYPGTYLTLYFSVRARALASFLSASLGIIVNLIVGSFLDIKSLRRSTRARFGFAGLLVILFTGWIWGTVVQNEYQKNPPSLDWSSPGFGRGFGVYIFFQVGWTTTEAITIFLIGSLANHPREYARLTSLLRSFASLGSTLGFGIAGASSVRPLTLLALDFGWLVIATIPAIYTVAKIGKSVGIRDGQTDLVTGQEVVVHAKSALPGNAAS